MLFLCLLFILFAVMTWLVLYPTPVIIKYLQLYKIDDMEYKLLLVALAALNLLICFVLEVSVDCMLDDLLQAEKVVVIVLSML